MEGFYYIFALLDKGSAVDLYKHKVHLKYFSEEEKSIFEFIEKHVETYSELPSLETVINLGYKKVNTPEPIEFYLERLKNRYIYKILKLGIETSIDDLKTDSGKACNTLQIVLDTIYLENAGSSLTNYQTDSLLIFKEAYNKAMLEENKGVTLGYNSLDNPFGLLEGAATGIRGGDIVSVVGRPASGKSFILLNMSLNIWNIQKKSVLFVSMEMNTQVICERLTSLLGEVSFGHVKEMALTTKEKQKIENRLTKVVCSSRLNEYLILDGNLTSSVSEIFAISKQFKIEAVFIDGCYLLSHSNSRLDRFTKVAENIEAIKKISSQLGIPCICSFQFNREASKNKGGKLEHIAYSDAIGQVSSIVIGLNDTEEDANPSILKKRKVDVLKGRNGESGEFYIKWDFRTMDFSEIIIDSKSDINYSPHAVPINDESL